jgi:oxygen-dependent protoporphyrinogen oxidase
MRRVAVIGGGLSGLTTAFLILEEAAAAGVPVDLSLWEAAERYGGKIGTVEAGGFRCETGPNGFLDNVTQTLQLVERLGLKERLIKSSDAARNRFLFSDGKLRQLPEDPLSFLRSNLLSLRGRLRIIGEYWVSKKPPGGEGRDETVASFVRRRLGEEALQKLIDPMVSGIYAGDPERMSMVSCFPRVAALEENYGGLIRGLLAKRREAKAAGGAKPASAGPGGTLTSFETGLRELTDALAARLGDRGRTSTPVSALAGVGRGREVVYELSPEGNQKIQAEAVVLATPAYTTAEILSGLAPETAALLERIPYSAIAVVHFGYPREEVAHPLQGFGFLIPHREQRRILGSLWSSSIFRNRASKGKVLLTNMVGGARDPLTPLGLDEELFGLVRSELQALISQVSPPVFSRLTRWDKGIPQYVPGHEARLRKIEERVDTLPGIFLVGNAYRGIGVNDCVQAAGRIAPRVVEYLGRRT